MNSLFFCSPIGLGHATRDVAIVEQFEDKTTFVTGSVATDFLKRSKCNVLDKYIPPQFTMENGSLKKPLKWLWQYYQYYKECKKAAQDIIKNQIPDIVISDEDFASLTISQEHKIPNVLITDILETKFTNGISSILEKRMNRSMRNIMSKCDVIIMPEYGNDEKNIKRVGPIVRTTKFSREQLREQMGFDKKTIVVSTGGTSAGEFLIQHTLDVIDEIKNDYDIILVSGPSLKKQYNNVKNLGFVNNLHEIIFAADLIVSIAGKSTIDEANAYGTPGIFIPVKNHFEQEDNARRQGYTHDDITRLDELVEEKISESRRPVKCDGAQKAYEIIKNISKNHT